jgi:hypothetical protein
MLLTDHVRLAVTPVLRRISKLYLTGQRISGRGMRKINQQ